jgi:hypothetical protein
MLGFAADALHSRLHVPRSICIAILATGFLISQLLALSIERTEDLWKASTCLGLSYGMMFGIFPTVVIEWFGLGAFFVSQK